MIDERKLIGELDAWWETLDPRTNARDSIICDVIESVIEKIDNAEKVGKPVKCGSVPGCSNCELNTDEESGCLFGFLKWGYEDADCLPDAGKPNSRKGGCEGCHYQGNHILNLPCCHCERAIMDCFEPKKKSEKKPEKKTKTRQDEFLKYYPNAETGRFTGVLTLCPTNVDGKANVPTCTDCDKCRRDYWSQEVE